MLVDIQDPGAAPVCGRPSNTAERHGRQRHAGVARAPGLRHHARNVLIRRPFPPAHAAHNTDPATRRRPEAANTAHPGGTAKAQHRCSLPAAPCGEEAPYRWPLPRDEGRQHGAPPPHPGHNPPTGGHDQAGPTKRYAPSAPAAVAKRMRPGPPLNTKERPAPPPGARPPATRRCRSTAHTLKCPPRRRGLSSLMPHLPRLGPRRGHTRVRGMAAPKSREN